MKIIIGSQFFLPEIYGVSIAVEKLAKALSLMGHKVYVFSPGRESGTAEEIFDDYSVVRVSALPNPLYKNFRLTFVKKKGLEELVNEINPDIIHLQDPTSLCSILLAIARKNNIPVVVTNHFSLDLILAYIKRIKRIHPPFKIALKKYLSGFYNKCDAVISPTDTVWREVDEWGVRTRIEVVSNGVDIKRFSPPKGTIKKDQILYVGRLDSDKSVNVLIGGFARIAKKRKDLNLVLVGEGYITDGLKRLIVELGIKERVIFKGRIDHDSPELEKVYQESLLFVMPSSIETQSIATLEAMAAGLPVVGANGGALPELVLHDKNGYLFPPHDEKKLAEFVETALDKKNYQKMSEYALKLVKQHSFLESMEKIEEIYQKTIQMKQVRIKKRKINTIVGAAAVIILAVIAIFIIKNPVMPQTAIYFLSDVKTPKSGEKLLVFTPHQDDETVGVGGYIARAEDRGVLVKIVLVTDGNYLHEGKKRNQEFVKATGILGVPEKDLVFLNFKDASLRKMKDKTELDEALKEQIDNFKPQYIVYPSAMDHHSDHMTIGEEVRKILKKENNKAQDYQYLIHYWKYPQPSDYNPPMNILPPVRLVSRDHEWLRSVLDKNDLDKKNEAVFAYKTQLGIPFLHTLLLSFIRQNELFINEK